MDVKKIEENLCRSFCEEIKIIAKEDRYIIETPFSFPDGDLYQIYLERLSHGGFKLTDGGHTLMHLSYENDIDKFRQGSRNILLENIKSEFDIHENNGEFFIESIADNISNNIFKLGQAVTKICDISFLNRAKVQKTFYEDLSAELQRIVPEGKAIEKDYIFNLLDNADSYPIDYNIKTGKKDNFFFIFAIGNKDKAQLATIILERLLRTQVGKSFVFNSLTVFEDIDSVPKKITNRLLNVGGECITSLNGNRDELERKVEKFVA